MRERLDGGAEGGCDCGWVVSRVSASGVKRVCRRRVGVKGGCQLRTLARPQLEWNSNANQVVEPLKNSGDLDFMIFEIMFCC